MKKAKWVYGHLEEILLGMLLSVIVLISGIQVVARYVFNNSLTWSEELCRYLYVWSGFLTVGFCIKHGCIIKIDTLTMFLPEKVQKVLNVFTSILCFVVIAMLFQASLGVVGKVVSTGQLTPAMRIPIWLVYLCAPIGYGLIELRLVEHVWKLVVSGRKSEEGKAK